VGIGLRSEDFGRLGTLACRGYSAARRKIHRSAFRKARKRRVHSEPDSWPRETADAPADRGSATTRGRLHHEGSRRGVKCGSTDGGLPQISNHGNVWAKDLFRPCALCDEATSRARFRRSVAKGTGVKALWLGATDETSKPYSLGVICPSVC